MTEGQRAPDLVKARRDDEQGTKSEVLFVEKPSIKLDLAEGMADEGSADGSLLSAQDPQSDGRHVGQVRQDGQVGRDGQVTEPLQVGDRSENKIDLVPEVTSKETRFTSRKNDSIAKQGRSLPPAEIELTLNQLPKIWLIHAILLFMVILKLPLFIVLLVAYPSIVYCSTGSARAMAKLFGTRALSIRNAFLLELMPFLSVILAIGCGLSALVVWAGNLPILPALIGFVCGIGAIVSGTVWYIHQWRWPFQASMALFKTNTTKPWSKRSQLLASAATAILFNMVPFYIVHCIVVYVQLAGVFGPDRSLFGMALLGYTFVQFAGFYVLDWRIREAANRLPGYKTHRQAKKKKVSNDDFTVRYRAFAELERWFEHRFRSGSKKKLIYLLLVMIIFFGLNVPQWCLDLLDHIAPTVLSGGGAAGGATGGLNLLTILQWSILSIVGGAGLFYISKPTHIGFSKKGVRFLWRHGIFSFNGLYLRWPVIRRINLLMPPGKTSPSDQNLLFETDSPEKFKIKLGSILEMDDRERMLKAIETWAPSVPRDVGVLQALERSADHSYTELWMQALSAPPKRERFKPLAEGATLLDGRFIVHDQLGVGGQGTAYLATDTRSGSEVVLKEFILPVYVDVSVRRQSLERFENEARLLKDLDHEQIVKLIEFFVEDHRSYLVLEHIDGQSLKQLVEERGPLPEGQVKELAGQMCKILEYLHGLSPPVVHRDFTPDNLILRTDGTLKLVDFNVAQQAESTATGTVVGKHAYLPPEQFRGTPCPQSDIYSMGATLHFLLTGSEPEPISTSHPQKNNQAVSGSMDFIVSKATAINLDDRYKTAGELNDELRRMNPELPEHEDVLPGG